MSYYVTNDNSFLDIKNAHLRVTSGNVYATGVVTTANVEVGGELTVTGNVAVGDDLTVTGNVAVDTDTLFVDSVNNRVGIGTDTPLDTLHVDGGIRFAGHIIPTANEQYDIGSAAFKIRDMYVSDNSLWIGDEAKISFTGNQIKFRRRKKSVVPSGLTTLGAAHGKDAATVQSEALASASGVSTVADMKLHHWMAYAKSLDTTKTTGDIFTDSADDYEVSAASEAFKEVGDDIYSAHNVSIGKSTAPTTALDVNGTVTATAFSGALAGNATTATSAATLTTARDIGGVSFNGSANITLPGVNADGNQNTSGNAATATQWATGRTIEVTGGVTGTTSAFDGSEDATLVTTLADLDAAKITSGTLPVTRGGTGTTTSTGTGSVVLSAAPAFTGDVTFDTDTLKIDSTNNRVGIGTTSPEAKLHVKGGSICVHRTFPDTPDAGIVFMEDHSNKDCMFIAYDGGGVAETSDESLRFYSKSAGGADPTITGANLLMTLQGNGLVQFSYTEKFNLFYAPAAWGYSTTSTTDTNLWTFDVTIPQEGYLILNTNGHWNHSVAGYYIYAKIGVDSNDPSDTSGFYDSHTIGGASTNGGDFHSYKDSSVSWQDFNWSGILKVAAGTRTICMRVKTPQGGTVYINGAAVSMLYIPKNYF